MIGQPVCCIQGSEGDIVKRSRNESLTFYGSPGYLLPVLPQICLQNRWFLYNGAVLLAHCATRRGRVSAEPRRTIDWRINLLLQLVLMVTPAGKKG